jgi:hypothetical protein
MKDVQAEIGEPRKWVQILSYILHQIGTGQLEEGDLIGVARVAKEFKTSRETASKAIRLLAEHDIVRRGPFGYEVLTRRVPGSAEMLNEGPGDIAALGQITALLRELTEEGREQAAAMERLNVRAGRAEEQLEYIGSILHKIQSDSIRQ